MSYAQNATAFHFLTRTRVGFTSADAAAAAAVPVLPDASADAAVVTLARGVVVALACCGGVALLPPSGWPETSVIAASLDVEFVIVAVVVVIS